MANSEHLAKLKEGVETWNKWRRANPKIVPDLRNAALTRAILSEVNLRRADLAAAILNETDLSFADLREANLTGTTFAVADLSGALLSGADLAGAEFGQTNLGDNDLSETRGLCEIEHIGPSMIGIETIYRSQGRIPLEFLRGAGVAENFIEYMPSLVAPGAIQFYSCFISYSTQDQEFADRLYADLQNKGVRCWFAPHDIQGGKKIHEQIDEAIRRYERLLLILSTDSMKSKWVETEILKARKREVAESKRVLFPVSLVPFEVLRDWKCFDSDTGEDLAREIREYYIPDFSNWKNHDSYAEALKKLLDGLKARDSKAA